MAVMIRLSVYSTEHRNVIVLELSHLLIDPTRGHLDCWELADLVHVLHDESECVMNRFDCPSKSGEDFYFCACQFVPPEILWLLGPHRLSAIIVRLLVLQTIDWRYESTPQSVTEVDLASVWVLSVDLQMPLEILSVDWTDIVLCQLAFSSNNMGLIGWIVWTNGVPRPRKYRQREVAVFDEVCPIVVDVNSEAITRSTPNLSHLTHLAVLEVAIQQGRLFDWRSINHFPVLRPLVTWASTGPNVHWAGLTLTVNAATTVMVMHGSPSNQF